MRIIRQSEAAECGLACLAMVADHYGYKIDITSLRSKGEISLKGVNLKQLISLADKFNLASRAVRVEIEDLAHLSKPCILHWNMDHFVVLKKVAKKHIVILDPASGLRKVTMSEVDTYFTGIALELYPTVDFEKFDARQKIKLQNLWGNIADLGKGLAKLFTLSIFLQVFMLVSPFFVQIIIDRVSRSGDIELLTALCGAAIILLILQSVTEKFRGETILRISASLSKQMSLNTFTHMVRLPLSFFEKRHIGDITSRFDSLYEIKDVLSTKFIESIIDGVVSIILLALMFFYSVQLALVVTFSVFIYFVARYSFYRKFRDINESTIIATAKEQSSFIETVRGVQAVKLFGAQEQRTAAWFNSLLKRVEGEFQVGNIELKFRVFNNFVFGLENIVVLFLAALAIMDKTLSIGMIFAFLAYKLQFTDRSSKLIDNLIELRMLGLHLERVSDVLSKETESNILKTDLLGNSIKGELRLDNVSFRYSQLEPFVFKNVSLLIEPGSSVAICGASGGGKTTLLKIMLGLVKPENGRVSVDDIGIDQLTEQQLRKHMSAVMQDDTLMTGSLLQNISFFDTEVDVEWAIKCARVVELHDEIMNMPMGYNSLVGDMGSSLSGGQKQRLILARALYRKPKILFMDEATSNLDEALEIKINNAISSMNITRIIIAHRRETLDSAERKVKLEYGRLIEE